MSRRQQVRRRRTRHRRGHRLAHLGGGEPERRLLRHAERAPGRARAQQDVSRGRARPARLAQVGAQDPRSLLHALGRQGKRPRQAQGRATRSLRRGTRRGRRGLVDGDGYFKASLILAKHSEEYKAPHDGAEPGYKELYAAHPEGRAIAATGDTIPMIPELGYGATVAALVLALWGAAGRRSWRPHGRGAPTSSTRESGPRSASGCSSPRASRSCSTPS